MLSSPTKLVVEFTKMHGAGNDFILLDNRFLYLTENELANLARRYCPRRLSLGADGLIALSNPKSEGADFAMDYYNSDGSRGEMCGNGARCLVRFAWDSGIQKRDLTFDSDIGICTASILELDPSNIEVRLPVLDDKAQEIELSAAIDHNFSKTFFLNTGVPHVVGIVDNLEDAHVELVGAKICEDSQFPEGTNVNFVKKSAGDTSYQVRTFERGVNKETLACGTGAIAVASAMSSRSESEKNSPLKTSIIMPGGTLLVELPLNKKGPVKLTGPTFKVCRGSLEL